MSITHVVIDTNVLVSALWSQNGTPAKIAHMIPDGKIVPCYSNEIMEEYREVLSRDKFSFPQGQINALFDNIKKYGQIFAPEPSTAPMTDEDDRIFYDTAITSKAILITGNKKHFPPEPFIMEPAEFVTKFG